jgi:8-oxo-dGTP diphosphatase
MEKQLKKYVLGFAFSRDGEEIVLINKNRPEWQKGKLNGIGGKIEPEDNCPNDAMIREFKEETGVATFIGGLCGWHHFATMVFKNDIMGGEALVYCFKMQSNAIYQCETTEDEPIERIKLSELSTRSTMANVHTLISLAKSEFHFTELVSN